MAIIIPCNHFHAFRLLQLMGIPFYISLSIFPFPFLISTSLFIRLRSSIDFYFAKVSQAGNTANTGTSPIGGKLFMTLRNHRLRFPENFAGQFFALDSLNTCDLTLHIKGSR